jgi:hypothetical protein
VSKTDSVLTVGEEDSYFWYKLFCGLPTAQVLALIRPQRFILMNINVFNVPIISCLVIDDQYTG